MRGILLTFCAVTLVAFCAAIPIERTTDGSERISTVETNTEIVGVAERIRDAFKFMLLANSKPISTQSATVKSETTKPVVDGHADYTTVFGFMTVYETTEDPLEEDEQTKPVLIDTTKPATAPPAVSSTHSSTPSLNSTLPIRSKTTRNQDPFNFIVLDRSLSTQRPNDSTTVSVLSTLPQKSSTSGSNDESTYVNEYAFITVYATTAEPELDTNEGSDSERTTPEAARDTTTTRLTTKRRPYSKRTAVTTRRNLTKKNTVTQTPKDGDKIYKLKNSGIQFIIKSTVGPPSTITNKKTRKTLISHRSESPNARVTTEGPEIWDDYFTTDESNGSLLIGGVVIGPGPVVPPADVAYFPNPAIFWAKYWYWILIILLLIVFLFIIPGFCCQIYLSRWCKKRKLHRFFDKRSHIFDFEKIGFGIRKIKSKEVGAETEHVDSFSSSDSSSDVEELEPRITSPDLSDGSDHLPASSLPEADIPQRETTETRHSEKMISGSENATVIVIPDPMSEIRVTRLSLSQSDDSPVQPSFEFPEPANDALPPTVIPTRNAPSTHSQSDLGLDIGNETIIKSNHIAKPAKMSPPPVFRPLKPEHMVPQSKPPEIAPSNRPRRSPQKKREDVRHRPPQSPKHNKEENFNPARPAKQTKPSRKKGELKKRSTKKKEAKPRKKIDANTQSLMKAAKSLEDILDALSKLTREYPIPDLPDTNHNKKERLKDANRRPVKFDDVPRKSPTRERRNASPSKRHFPDEDMVRRKEKRTKNWANEQRKMEKDRDRKKRKPEKKSPRKKDPDSRQKRKKREQKKSPKKTTEEKEDGDSGKPKKKVPTLMKEELPTQNKTKQERRRMRLERDLKKLQRYHNSRTKSSEETEETKG